MLKDEKMREIEKALIGFLCEGSDRSCDRPMEILVDSFLEQEMRNHTPEELELRFSSVEDVIGRFSKFLKTQRR
jgi:hypothetical protein